MLEQVLTNAVKYTRKEKFPFIWIRKKKKRWSWKIPAWESVRKICRVSLNGDIPGTTEGSRTVPPASDYPVQTDHGNAGTSYFGKIRAGKRDMYLSGSCSRSSPGLLKTYTDVRLKRNCKPFRWICSSCFYTITDVRNENLKRSCGWWSIKYKRSAGYYKTQ